VWFRLDALMDAAGTLTGQRLTVGRLGAGGRTIDLPPESFATGPWDGRVLIGADDGARSRLSLVDVGAACATVLAEENAVVRAALVTPDGSAVVEHRVDRATRADLGVWRVPIDGGRSRRVVAGLTADARYGRTFSTELRWAPQAERCSGTGSTSQLPINEYRRALSINCLWASMEFESVRGAARSACAARLVPSRTAAPTRPANSRRSLIFWTRRPSASPTAASVRPKSSLAPPPTSSGGRPCPIPSDGRGRASRCSRCRRAGRAG